ncbi:hypothetical protein EC917_13021 [Bacillus thuringiensis]|uniref:Uncharacterized protein n=1 Tax=Bacillus thuringiensis TaxID=1428 RepID=A0A4R4AZC5_BACTU|nr:hypothetical protein EC917_13021 [Bacillus thuringiensis]TCW46250.1 hypothetical protein EC910_12921 [Bacillus thuringiensis]
MKKDSYPDYAVGEVSNVGMMEELKKMRSLF